MEKVREFKIGDKVKIINKTELGGIFKIQIGDTAIVEREKDRWGDLKIRMDKDDDWWYLKTFNLELISSTITKFEVIIDGTTTTVKLEDGKTGMATLHPKDTYNKGFGIITALGRALDMDLVADVLKVTKSIKPDEVVKKLELLGLFSTPNPFNKKFQFKEGKPAEYIFKVGDKVKIPKTKSKDEPKLSFQKCVAIGKKQYYLYIAGIHKDGIYELSAHAHISSGDFYGVEDLVLYKEPATVISQDEAKYVLGDTSSITVTDTRTGKVVLSGTIDTNKKTILSDIVESYVVGDKLNTIEQLEVFIKSGGKVKHNAYIYYEKKGNLKYKTPDGKKEFSDGYRNISLPAIIFKLPKSIIK